MSVVSSHSRPQSDEQPRSTIFSPANFSGPRKAKRGTTDHSQSSASDLLDEYKARPRHRDSLSVPQPLQQQSSGSISIHHANPSPQRLRRRNKEPTMSHLAGTSALSQDSHFEKMLALLEVDDSLPDTADRRSASGDNGANVFYTPRRSRDLEVSVYSSSEDEEILLTRSLTFSLFLQLVTS